MPPMIPESIRTVEPFRPALVSWNLTRRCNLRCPHCYLEAGRPAGEELSTAECLALLEELQESGTEMLILTGGEPLLRRDIHELARAASAAGIWTVMGTNGVLLTDAVAATMVDCGVRGVAISLDSADPARHDAFRGGPGSWQHAVRALDTCRAHGLQVLVQTTVTEDNALEVPALIDFARGRGAWSFNLYFLVQTGRGRAMEELSPARTEEVLTTLVDQQEAHRPMLVRAKCAPQFKRIAWQRGQAGLESGGCMAGTQYCRITPEGDVTPCPYMTAVAGNVRALSFREIWLGSPLLASLRNPARLGGRCGACEFRELCGGCRCRAFAATGDVLAEDPGCPHQPSGRALEEAPVAWSAAARARLERIPIAFIRSRVERGIEAYARRQGAPVITAEVMDAGLQGSGRGPAPFGRGEG
jgi:AdoMet-dependent heme synthase